MVQNADGAVEISNKGEYEINLFGYKLQSGAEQYDFPQDTIISAYQSVIFPRENFKFINNNSQIILVDVLNKEISNSSFSVLLSNQETVVTVSDFEKFAVAYKKLTQPETYTAVAMVSPVSAQLSLVSEAKEATVEIPLTAAVAVAPGFWGKLFHPIRTIKGAFYR